MNSYSLTTVRQNLPKLVKQAKNEGESFEITVNGRFEAVIMSAEDYEELIETIEILSDQAILKDINKSEKQIKKKEVVKLSELK